MWYINQYKPRLVILGPKFEGLPDGHPSKPQCLYGLFKLQLSVGNFEEGKRLLVHTLSLWRKWGIDPQIAGMLRCLAGANSSLGLYKEGILQLEEALGIYERLDNTVGQVESLRHLASLLAQDGQVDAAEEAVSRAANLSSDVPSQHQLYSHHYTLGCIYDARGEMEVAINHYEKAFKTISSLNLPYVQVLSLRCLVIALIKVARFDDARVYLERLKSNGTNDPYSMCLAVTIQIHDLCRQGRFEEARSEASRIIGVFEKIGASGFSVKLSKELFQRIEEEMNKRGTDEGELLRTVPPLASTNSFCTESER